MPHIRKLLLPFSVLYGSGILLRNFFYKKGIFRSKEFPVPVICVGNLSFGGTGKTPMVEVLVEILKNEYKVAVLSRGYKRKTSGFLLLNGKETASEAGDEPLQFKTKFPEITVAVDENRSHGITRLLELKNAPEVIILDDAFQHLKVRAGLNILLSSFSDLYVEDLVLPAGNLREPKKGASRANIVVVTKCPAGISIKKKEEIRKRLKLAKDQKLFFSRINYSDEVKNDKTALPLDSLRKKEIVLITGIANPAPLLSFLRKRKIDFLHLKFSDHHSFSSSEIEKIQKGHSGRSFLTTEKDFMRLKDHLSEEKLFYLPINSVFTTEEEAEDFSFQVRKYVKKEILSIKK